MTESASESASGSGSVKELRVWWIYRRRAAAYHFLSNLDGLISYCAVVLADARPQALLGDEVGMRIRAQSLKQEERVMGSGLSDTR